MKPFLSSVERGSLLYSEADSWIGTPFVPHAGVRRHGVDCVMLCLRLLQAVGHLPLDVKLPRYTMDGGRHNADSQLTLWLDAHGDSFAKVEREGWEPTAGDILCFRIGRSEHHAGIVVERKKFIHCMFRHRVVFATLADLTFSKRLVSVYRPIEKETT